MLNPVGAVFPLGYGPTSPTRQARARSERVASRYGCRRQARPLLALSRDCCLQV